MLDVDSTLVGMRLQLINSYTVFLRSLRFCIYLVSFFLFPQTYTYLHFTLFHFIRQSEGSMCASRRRIYAHRSPHPLPSLVSPHPHKIFSLCLPRRCLEFTATTMRRRNCRARSLFRSPHLRLSRNKDCHYTESAHRITCGERETNAEKRWRERGGRETEEGIYMEKGASRRGRKWCRCESLYYIAVLVALGNSRGEKNIIDCGGRTRSRAFSQVLSEIEGGRDW